MWLDISIWSTYVDTDGHTVVFRRNGTGKLDCHVNGEPFAIDVHSLELQDGKIIFGGTEAGSSSESSWTSTPVNSLDAERVLALYGSRVTPDTRASVERTFVVWPEDWMGDKDGKTWFVLRIDKDDSVFSRVSEVSSSISGSFSTGSDPSTVPTTTTTTTSGRGTYYLIVSM